jgi:hypothetical protein
MDVDVRLWEWFERLHLHLLAALVLLVLHHEVDIPRPYRGAFIVMLTIVSPFDLPSPGPNDLSSFAAALCLAHFALNRFDPYRQLVRHCLP